MPTNSDIPNMNKSVSHMGRCNNKPDNTIEAFQSAIDAGFSMIELDIRKTKDNHIIIHHDDNVNSHLISQTSLTQLQSLKPNLPTLTQVLELFKTQTTFDIEFKEAGYEAYALQTILQHLTYKQFIITSFNFQLLTTLRRTDPNVQLGYIVDITDLTNTKLSTIKNNLSIHKTFKAKINAIIANSDLFFLNFINRANKHNLDIYVWNVTTQEDYNKYDKDPRITKIITDKPYHTGQVGNP